MDPIPAKQVKVEQPVVPPCEFFVLMYLDNGEWIIDSHLNCELAEAQDTAKTYAEEVPTRLFHLSDAPVVAPLAADAGVRDSIVDRMIEFDSSLTVKEGRELVETVMKLLRERGWGPKGEEWNAAIEAAAKHAGSWARGPEGGEAFLADEIRSLKHGGVA